MRLINWILLALLCILQYRLWVGEGSLAEVYNLKQELTAQQKEVEQLTKRNQALMAEVKDLKEGLAAVEELARTDMGMIREGETFYQIVDEPAPPLYQKPTKPGSKKP